MAAVKYSISFLKKDPLLKIKVTGIYHEKDQYFYYRNPVTGCWQRIKGTVKKERLLEKNISSLEGIKKVINSLKKLADKFYEENKVLFGGTTPPNYSKLNRFYGEF
ncbi:MAG: hypothetical protein GX081_07825 [Firmicutes bacterium]|nr:hypothetical protein [Bacillota bacterium]